MTPLLSIRTVLLTAAAMVCFAANSLLARLALREAEVDWATYTGIRIISGALTLMLLIRIRGDRRASLRDHGSWVAAAALFGYAAAFSFAYLWLEAGVGSLILFAAVQITMITAGLVRGERLLSAEWSGLSLAVAGFVYLVSPGLSAPHWAGAILMSGAGFAWGVYSLAARGAGSPIAATASNFTRATPAAVILFLGMLLTRGLQTSMLGIELAVISGAVTSGIGYAVWYSALRGLNAAQAAIVQLTVPVIAASGAVLFLGESATWRLVLAGTAILGGVTLALSARRKSKP